MESLTCVIHYGLINDPVTWPCGHNFCNGCSLEHANHNAASTSVRCPLCNRMMEVETIRALHPNIMLRDMIERLHRDDNSAPVPTAPPAIDASESAAEHFCGRTFAISPRLPSGSSARVCVDVTHQGGVSPSGSSVQWWAEHGGPNQRFFLSPALGDSVTLSPVHDPGARIGLREANWHSSSGRELVLTTFRASDAEFARATWIIGGSVTEGFTLTSLCVPGAHRLAWNSGAEPSSQPALVQVNQALEAWVTRFNLVEDDRCTSFAADFSHGEQAFSRQFSPQYPHPANGYFHHGGTMHNGGARMVTEAVDLKVPCAGDPPSQIFLGAGKLRLKATPLPGDKVELYSHPKPGHGPILINHLSGAVHWKGHVLISESSPRVTIVCLISMWPAAPAMWPAVWLSGRDDANDVDGEVDIFEFVGDKAIQEQWEANFSRGDGVVLCNTVTVPPPPDPDDDDAVTMYSFATMVTSPGLGHPHEYRCDLALEPNGRDVRVTFAINGKRLTGAMHPPGEDHHIAYNHAGIPFDLILNLQTRRGVPRLSAEEGGALECHGLAVVTHNA